MVWSIGIRFQPGTASVYRLVEESTSSKHRSNALRYDTISTTYVKLHQNRWEITVNVEEVRIWQKTVVTHSVELSRHSPRNWTRPRKTSIRTAGSLPEIASLELQQPSRLYLMSCHF